MSCEDAKTKYEIALALGITRTSLHNYIVRCGVPAVGNIPGTNTRLYGLDAVSRAIDARKKSTYVAHCGCAEKMRAERMFRLATEHDDFESIIRQYRARGYSAMKIAKALKTTVARIWPIIERAA